MTEPEERKEMLDEIAGMCKTIRLTSSIPDYCHEKATDDQLQFMGMALQQEIRQRDKNRIERLKKRARFPLYKTFDNYDFSYAKLPPLLTREEIINVEFIPRKQNLILYGGVGLGKTHMAIAAGMNACMKGYKVRFYTVTELVLRLSEARKNGTLERVRRDLRNQDLLILDEWGYVPVDRDGSQLLFQVISDSYENKSLILTTNIEFSKWGGIFTDEQMAAAMIDRLVHHGHLILFEGTSYRMEHALMNQTARQPSDTESML